MQHHPKILYTFLVAFLFLITLPPIRAQAAPYQVMINQSLDEAALLAATAVETWIPTAGLFVSVNTAMLYSIGNLSLIYSNTTSDPQLFINASLSNGECPVAPFDDLIQNTTLVLEFFCCHVQKLRSPGLLLSLAQMYGAYFSSTINMVDPTSTLLDYIRQIAAISTIGTVSAACLDDITVTQAQGALAIALASEPPSGILLQTYRDLILNTATLFTCVESLSPVCKISGPLNTTTVPPPDLNFPDVGFELVCGYETLSAFELARFTTPCAPL